MLTLKGQDRSVQNERVAEALRQSFGEEAFAHFAKPTIEVLSESAEAMLSSGKSFLDLSEKMHATVFFAILTDRRDADVSLFDDLGAMLGDEATDGEIATNAAVAAYTALAALTEELDDFTSPVEVEDAVQRTAKMIEASWFAPISDEEAAKFSAYLPATKN